MAVKVTKFDVVDYLTTTESRQEYLSEAMLTNDYSLISAALGDIARAEGIGSISKATGLTRTSLYKSLSETGNPELGTIIKVVNAVGLSLTTTPYTERP